MAGAERVQQAATNNPNVSEEIKQRSAQAIEDLS